MAGRSAVDAARASAMRAGSAYTSVDLDGMVMDLDAALDGAGLTAREIARTGEPECLVVATCIPARPMGADDAREALEQAWVDARFDGEAHLVTAAATSATLDFVTWWTRTGAYCTGRVVVELPGA